MGVPTEILKLKYIVFVLTLYCSNFNKANIKWLLKATHKIPILRIQIPLKKNHSAVFASHGLV